MSEVAEQVARLRRLSAAELSTAPPIPKSAKIELHAHCALRCGFCSARHRAVEAPMDLALFRRIVQELRDSGVERLGLFYLNEPFPDERLPQAIEIAKACGLSYVFLTTSGYGARPEQVRSCIEAGLDSLKFALNFSHASQYPAAPGAPHDVMAEVLANVRLARAIRDAVFARSGLSCRLSASSLAFDDQQAARMRPVIEQIQQHVDEHYWLPFFGRIDLAPAETSPQCETGDGVLRKPVPCWTLFSEAHVRADGELSACCLDASRQFAMGNLRDIGFRAAWHGQRFRALRQSHLSGDVSRTACARCIGYQ